MCNMRYFNRELYDKAEYDLKEHVEIWQVGLCSALRTSTTACPSSDGTLWVPPP